MPSEVPVDRLLESNNFERRNRLATAPSQFKASLLHLPVDGIRFLGGQKGSCAAAAKMRVGVRFTKVNGDRYRAMITNFFIPELNNHDVQELWFQQDGATCHTARATIDLLKDTFGDRLISRFGPVNWPQDLVILHR
ncbi:hypothetical protein TNCV_1465121 [Trichonephila clavipes]|nr:hypothetical protein TNCV_1465121 [Trichonephila clavipes]